MGLMHEGNVHCTASLWLTIESSIEKDCWQAPEARPAELALAK